MIGMGGHVEDDAGAGATHQHLQGLGRGGGRDSAGDPVEHACPHGAVEEEDHDRDDDAAGEIAELLEEEERAPDIATDAQVAAVLEAA